MANEYVGYSGEEPSARPAAFGFYSSKTIFLKHVFTISSSNLLVGTKFPVDTEYERQIQSMTNMTTFAGSLGVKD